MRGITDTVKHLLIINALMFIGTYALRNEELFYSLFGDHFRLFEMIRSDVFFFEGYLSTLPSCHRVEKSSQFFFDISEHRKGRSRDAEFS